jgi:uncharacterized RDD family membrane protein YckC
MDQSVPPEGPAPAGPAPAGRPPAAEPVAAPGAGSPPGGPAPAAWTQPTQPASPAPPAATPAVMWATPNEPAATPAVMWATPNEPVGPAEGVEFAPHGPRLVAYLLDTLILTIVCGVILVIGLSVLSAGTTIEGDTITAVDSGAAALFLVLGLVTLIVGFLYFPFFWARGGQTPGMRPFGLRVVRDRDGGPIGLGTAILRLIGLWVATAAIYIGLIWIFVDERRRGWQDLIAGTVVVKRP